MTRKHFEAIAAGFSAQIKRLKDFPCIADSEARKDQILACAQMICDVAKSDNARFDRERFLAACGF